MATTLITPYKPPKITDRGKRAELHFILDHLLACLQHLDYIKSTKDTQDAIIAIQALQLHYERQSSAGKSTPIRIETGTSQHVTARAVRMYATIIRLWHKIGIFPHTIEFRCLIRAERLAYKIMFEAY